MITGTLALLGGLVLLPGSGARATRVSVVVAGAALALSGAQALAATEAKPDLVTIANPCEERDLPQTGGIGGIVQDVGLVGLTAQRASSAPRGRSSRLRWSTTMPPRATRMSTE